MKNRIVVSMFFLAIFAAGVFFERSHIAHADTTNLIANGDFETAGSNGLPAGWAKGGYGTNTRILTYPVTGDASSSKAAQVTISAYTSGDAKWFFTPSVSLTPGTTYAYTDSWMSTVPNVVDVQYTMSDGTFTYADIALLPASNTWTTSSADFTPPAGATAVTVFHLIQAVGTLTIDDASLTTAGTTPPPPPPDTTPPTVSITAPTSGQSVSGMITLSASASDDTGVAGVQFAIDGTNVGAEDTNAPYSTTLDTTTLANGSHSVTAHARDAAGNASTSAAVSFTVTNTTTPPPPPPSGNNLISNGDFETQSGSVPTGWAKGGYGTNTRTFAYPVAGNGSPKAAQVTISAYTSGDAKWYFATEIPVTTGTAYTYTDDSMSTAPSIVDVQYTMSGGTFTYADIASLPASSAWQTKSTTFTPPAGATAVTIFHLIQSVGSLTIDNATLTSGSGTGTTTPPTDTTPPSVSVTAPTSGQNASSTITLSANASDNVGVVGVQFAVDGTNVGTEDTSAPYSTTLDTTTLPDGPHSVTAHARDAAGNSATSTTVSFTVANTTTPPPPPPPPPNNNLVPNGDFETAGSNNLPAGWAQGGYGANTRTFTYPVAGNGSPKAAQVTISAYTSGDAKWYITPSIPVKPGDQYSLSDDYMATIPSVIDVQYTMSDGTFTYADLAAFPASSSWKNTGIMQFDVPAGATAVTVFHLIEGVGSLTIDNVLMQTDGAVPVVVTMTSPTAGQTVSGTITLAANASAGAGVAGVQFTVDSKNVGAEDTSAPYAVSLDTTTLPNGSHTMEAIARDTAGNTARSDVESFTVANTVTPPTNLVPNPGVETADPSDPNVPQSWNIGGFGNNTPIFTYPVAGDGSNRAIRVQITSYTDGDAKWYFDPITVAGDDEYTLTDRYNSDATSTVTLQFNDAAGNESFEGLDTLPSTDGAWKSYTTNILIPPGAVKLTVFHALENVGTLTTDNYSLTKLPSGKFAQGMVTFAFDDGLESQWQNAKPILDAAGIKGSFYIITDNMEQGFSGYMTTAQVQGLNADGQEIGAHTRTHPHLPTLTLSQMQDEIGGSKSDLAAIGATPDDVFVYPFGEYNDTVVGVVKQEGFIGARSSDSGFNTKNSNKFLLKDEHWENTTTVAQVEAWIDQAVANDQWLIFEIHDVKVGGDQFSTTPADFQTVINYVKSKNIKTVTVDEGLKSF